MVSYIERSRKATVLDYIVNAHSGDPNKITVCFVNQKGINEKDITADGRFKASGGISPTGTGTALNLDPNGNIKQHTCKWQWQKLYTYPKLK